MRYLAVCLVAAPLVYAVCAVRHADIVYLRIIELLHCLNIFVFKGYIARFVLVQPYAVCNGKLSFLMLWLIKEIRVVLMFFFLFGNSLISFYKVLGINIVCLNIAKACGFGDLRLCFAVCAVCRKSKRHFYAQRREHIVFGFGHKLVHFVCHAVVGFEVGQIYVGCRHVFFTVFHIYCLCFAVPVHRKPKPLGCRTQRKIKSVVYKLCGYVRIDFYGRCNTAVGCADINAAVLCIYRHVFIAVYEYRLFGLRVTVDRITKLLKHTAQRHKCPAVFYHGLCIYRHIIDNNAHAVRGMANSCHCKHSRRCK